MGRTSHGRRQSASRAAGNWQEPLPVYTLMASQGPDLAPVNANGFMYYSVVDGKTVAAITVNVDPVTGTARRGLMTSGGTDTSAAALQRLAKQEKVRAGSYEARLLTIRTAAGNTFPVFWLKADSGPQDDLYYPYRKYYDSAVQPETFYKLEDLLKLLGRQ